MTETVHRATTVTVDAFDGDDVEELARAKANEAEWEDVASDGFEFKYQAPDDLPLRPEHQAFLAAFLAEHARVTGLMADDFYLPADAVAEDVQKYGLDPS